MPNRDVERRAEIDRIGVRVKAERTARSWSLRRLATESGLSASLLSAVENGRIVPTVGSLFAISDALDVSAPELFPPSRLVRPAAGTRHDEEAEPTYPIGSIAPDRDVGRVEPMTSNEERPVTSPASGAADAPPVGVPSGGRSRRARRARRSPRVPARPDGAGPCSTATRRAVDRAESGEPDGSPGAAGAPDRTAEDVVGAASPVPPGSSAARPMPGVMITAPTASRWIPLPDGSVWTLIHRDPASGPVILEGTLSSGGAVPATYTVRSGATGLVVRRGRLRLESGFREVELESGAEATVEAGVPFRISAVRSAGMVASGSTPAEPSIVIVVMEGGWDGRLL